MLHNFNTVRAADMGIRVRVEVCRCCWVVEVGRGFEKDT